jgi:methylenetetrahydrofolate reductase (NADPH)
MHIRDIFGQPTTFVRVLLPRGIRQAALSRRCRSSRNFARRSKSVTYGAGGSTRQLTSDLVVRLKSQTSLDPVPHLTTVCHTADEIRAILDRHAKAGISNIMALRGDVPQDWSGPGDAYKDFRHAGDLVKFIRGFNESGTHPDAAGIGVAGFPEGHPDTPNRLTEMDRLKAKVDQPLTSSSRSCSLRTAIFTTPRAVRAGWDSHPRDCRIMPVTSIAGIAAWRNPRRK